MHGTELSVSLLLLPQSLLLLQPELLSTGLSLGSHLRLLCSKFSFQALAFQSILVSLLGCRGLFALYCFGSLTVTLRLLLCLLLALLLLALALVGLLLRFVLFYFLREGS